jgi:hypothetical protein
VDALKLKCCAFSCAADEIAALEYGISCDRFPCQDPLLTYAWVLENSETVCEDLDIEEFLCDVKAYQSKLADCTGCESRTITFECGITLTDITDTPSCPVYTLVLV